MNSLSENIIPIYLLYFISCYFISLLGDLAGRVLSRPLLYYRKILLSRVRIGQIHNLSNIRLNNFFEDFTQYELVNPDPR